MDKKFFVPFKTAKALKEKGYPEYADIFYDANFYDADGFLVNNFSGSDYDAPIVLPVISAPTYHEVLDWLEGRKVRIYAEYCNGWWYGFIDNSETMEIEATVRYQTREEALNASILKALEML